MLGYGFSPQTKTEPYGVLDVPCGPGFSLSATHYTITQEVGYAT